jgi:hypothetical protein
VGIACAKLGNRVYLTDLPDTIIQQNLLHQINENKVSSLARAGVLAWGECDSKLDRFGSPDLLIAADCFFDPDGMIQLFLFSLRRI